jgi:hypothetical protein
MNSGMMEWWSDEPAEIWSDTKALGEVNGTAE